MGSLFPEYHYDDLPRVIPIFPLTNAVLLPRGWLPLNIFEPRYLKMVKDAMTSDGLIGMIQPAVAHAEGQQDKPDLYKVGCVGQIDEHKTTEDGRELITLRGICRFSIVEEMPTTTPYRKVLASYARYRNDMIAGTEGAAQRDALLATLTRFFERESLNINWDGLDQADDETLINALSMLSPFAPGEKQALLEANDVIAREELLISLLEMSLAAPTGGPDKPTLQ